MGIAFTSEQLIKQGVLLEVQDVPDTHVYQLIVDIATLKGATTAYSGGYMLDVLNAFQTAPSNPIPVPPWIADTLDPGPAVVAAVGSNIDAALAAFPTLVKLASAYRSGGYVAIESTPVALPSTTGIVISGMGEYLGFTVRETSGVNRASVVLHDSLDATGAVLEEITLAAGESSSDHYERPGRLINTGIYAVITGTVEGSVFK